MTSIYTIALLACVLNLALRGSRQTALENAFAGLRRHVEEAIRSVGVERCAFVLIAFLVCLFFAEMRAIDEFVHLPPESSRVWYDLTTIILDMVEALTLGLTYVALSMSSFSRMVRIALIVAPVVMYGFAIFTKTVATSDLYAYIAYAKLGSLAYAPPSTPFTGPFAMLNAEIARAWIVLSRSVYGPLFLALDRFCAGQATSVAQAIFNLRLLSVAGVLVCGISLRRLGFGIPLLAIFLLDPEFIRYYAFDAHNDVLAVAAVLSAMAFAKRSRIAAIILGIAAGSIKANYTFLALLVAAGEETLPRRLGVAVTIAAGTVAVSALGGLPYLHALTSQVAANGVANFSFVTRASHAIAAVSAITAVFAAVMFRRTLFCATYTLPALAAQTLHWYAALGLPYAVFERRHAAVYFTIFPITTFLLNEYSLHPYPALVAIASLFAIFLFAVAKQRSVPPTHGPGMLQP
jgi:hypothetical protein